MEDMFVRERERAPEVVERSRMSGGVLFGIFAMLVPLSLALYQLGVTMLYLSDVEGTTGNELSAGALGFSVDADAPSTIVLSITGAGEEEGASVAPFLTPDPGSLPFSYELTAEMTGGDADFCNALYLKGDAPPFTYDDELLLMALGPSTDGSAWPVVFYLPALSYIPEDGAVCSFDLVYSGYQEGSEAGQAYHDEKRLSFSLTYIGSAPVIESFSASVAPLTLTLPEEGETVPEETTPTEEPPTEETSTEETSETEEVTQPEQETEGGQTEGETTEL